MRTLLKVAAIAAVVTLALPVVNHASPRVAFMGDSITQGWAFPRANFGIYGQTSAQMLARFPSQVPNQNFRTVVILGGTNDTLLGVDPATTIANLSQMVDLARAANVEPILAEIPPIYRQGGQFLPVVARLNDAIIALASSKHVKLADYYDALLDHPSCFSDGTHLKRRGYLRMELAWWQAHTPPSTGETPSQ